MFLNLHKKKSKGVVSDLFSSVLGMNHRSENGRAPALRPSSFPLCPILFWMKTIKARSVGYYEEEATALGHYYTRVGTTTHTTFQYWMGFTGKIYGNWKCIGQQCKKGRKARDVYDAAGTLVEKGQITVYNTVNNLCPACNSPMYYEELEIEYRGIKGHIDGVIQLDNGRYWVFDYKTSSGHKIDTEGLLPEKKHLYQLHAYSYVLKKQGLDIEGCSLLYISRDNPRKFVEKATKWTEKVNQRAKIMVLGEIKRYKAYEVDIADRSIKNIIRTKPCSCEQDYYEKMDNYVPCPMLEHCFDSRTLKNKLMMWKERYIPMEIL